MNDLERGYIAGIFDGEGYVSLRNIKNNASPEAKITNTNLKILKRITDAYNINKIPTFKSKSNKDCFDLRFVNHQEIVYFLSEIVDILEEKELNSRLILTYCIESLLKDSKYGKRTKIQKYIINMFIKS